VSAEARSPVGSIAWFDLTVADAVAVRDFYAAVVGWRPAPVDQGGYDDFNMSPGPDGPPVAGICHARGEIAALPPQWLAYLVVADLEISIGRCRDLGGALVAGLIGAGPGERFCVIRDPAGAVVALIEQSAGPGPTSLTEEGAP